MKKQVKFFVASLMLIPLICQAETIYLKCKTSNKENKSNISITINKDNEKVTHSSEDTNYKTEAVFTADAISYGKKVAKGVSEKIIINRETLAINKKLMINITQGYSTIGDEQNGQCKIAKKKKTKI